MTTNKMARRRVNAPGPTPEREVPVPGKSTTTPTGITLRHARTCPAAKTVNERGECKCKPAYQAWAYDRRSERKVYKTFARLSDARAWRGDATVGLRKRTMRAPSSTTLREAAISLVAGMKDGSIRNRKGARFKPSVIRSYDAALRLRVLPELGARRLSDIGRADLQDLADRMLAEGLDPSTIRNQLMPLRVVFRRAVSRGEVALNPTAALELPAVEGRRDRIASPTEAALLIEAVSDDDRATWALAFYAGLRLGEIRALEWSDVDLDSGLIRVRRSWDQYEGPVEPKSKRGTRTVPVARALRGILLEHRIRQGRGGEGLVTGRAASTPFNPTTVSGRAARAWGRRYSCGCKIEPETDEAKCPRHEAGPLTAIGLHEARHTFASLMIAAGVNAKALSTYLGHASISTTFDRYGHLMPGNEEEAAELLDAYLERAEAQRQVASQIRSARAQNALADEAERYGATIHK